MKRYQYEITRHPGDEFAHLVYFCTDQGECKLSQIPADQTDRLKHVLNSMGEEGWQLVQLFFGQEGVVAFWRREIS